MSFNDFCSTVSQRARDHKEWRYGQALFNTLLEVRPDLAEKIRGTDLDTFHVSILSEKIAKCFSWLSWNWNVK